MGLSLIHIYFREFQNCKNNVYNGNSVAKPMDLRYSEVGAECTDKPFTKHPELLRRK